MNKLLALALALLAVAQVDAQSTEQTTQLATLGKVWGFLKYYHSGVAVGRVHWDSALVAAVPQVKNARSPAAYRAVLQSLLDAAGPVRNCADRRGSGTPSANQCRTVFADSLRINLDLEWLADTALFGSNISQQLTHVRDNPHQGSGRYVSFAGTAIFAADTAFGEREYPAEGQRLLALFRFWNAARYYFPYMYVNGGDWNTVLHEFIPRLSVARNVEEYHSTVAEMTTRLHDAHVSTYSRPLYAAFGTRRPAFEARYIEGRVVVTKATPDSATPGALRRGDVITHIDGTTSADRRKGLAKYVAAGNESVFDRKVLTMMLNGRRDSATYTIERDNKSLVIQVAMARTATSSMLPPIPVAELARVLPNTNIGYLNMSDLNQGQVDSAIAIIGRTDGIVLDVRNYPRGTMYHVANFLNPDIRPFAKFTSVDSTFPGQVVWERPYFVGRAGGNAGYYRGRVAILVDERTQSHAEFTVMALRTAPQNKVIGSQTAGADGNITRLALPGELQTLFTGLGVYYPDGTPTQRVGIVPDIVVRPTIKGVRAGRDEVLERALEYIRTGR